MLQTGFARPAALPENLPAVAERNAGTGTLQTIILGIPLLTLLLDQWWLPMPSFSQLEPHDSSFQSERRCGSAERCLIWEDLVVWHPVRGA